IFGCDGGADHSVSRRPAALTTRLPAPRVRHSPEKVWTRPDQLARAAEVERYLLDTRYSRYRILDTVQTSHGTIIDYVDPATAGATDKDPPALPNPPASSPSLGVPETEESSDLKGPPGSIPFVRDDFGRYISGDSKADS